MKKIISLVCILCLGLSVLSGCVKPAQNEQTATNSVDYALVRQEMSNFACSGWYDIYDGWIYSFNSPVGGTGDAVLAKIRTDGSGHNVIADIGNPYYVNVDGENVYAIFNSEGGAKLYRCKLDGSELTKLSDDDVWYLQVMDEFLYYTKMDMSAGCMSGLYKSDKDGKNEELIMDKEVYYSYVVGDDVYYQDDADGETIHKYNLLTKSDEKITNGCSYGFVLDGETGYYIKSDDSIVDENAVFSIVKIDMKTKEETVLYDEAAAYGIVVSEEDVYFTNAKDENRLYSINKKDGSNIRMIAEEVDCRQLAIFGNMLMYTDWMDDESGIDNIYVCGLDGSNKVCISRK